MISFFIHNNVTPHNVDYVKWKLSFLHYWNISNIKNKKAKWKLINKRKLRYFLLKLALSFLSLQQNLATKLKKLKAMGKWFKKAGDMRCFHHSFVQMQININKAYNLVVKVAPRYAVNNGVITGLMGLVQRGWGRVGCSISSEGIHSICQ